MHRVVLLTLGLTLALAVRAGRADAAPGRFRLEYQRDPGASACPDEAAVRAAVSRRLGREPFAADASTTIVCRVAPVDGGLRATISVHEDGEGRVRVIVAPGDDCRELSSAVELALAVAIDPAAADEPVPVVDADVDPVPAAETAEVAPVEPPASAVVAAPAVGALAAPWRWRGEAGVAALVGASPDATVGGSLGAGLRGESWSFGLALEATWPDGVGVAGGRVDTARVGLVAAGCRHRGALAVCGLAAGGAWRGDGVGVPGARAGRAPYAAVGARAAWERPVGAGLALRVSLDVLAQVVGARVRVGDEIAYETESLAASAGLALVFGRGP